MRIAHWTLFSAALAVYAGVEGVSADKESAACIAPSVVASYELKIEDLKQSNDKLQRQVDAQDKEKIQLLADVAQEHEIIVTKLQTEIAALQNEVESREEALKTAKAELTSREDKFNTEFKRVSSLDDDVKELETSLANERALVAEMNAELKAAMAELAHQTSRVAQLEKSYSNMEKKNKALLKDLGENKSVELSMASLLSSYYDDALVLAEEIADFAQQKLNEQTDTLEHVQGHIETAKNAAWDTSSKFYQENLAGTLDPILIDVHETVHPHAEKYLTVLKNEAAKTQKVVLMYSREALSRAKRMRIESIEILEQNDYVAQYAQKIIDGILILLAVPLASFPVRLALRLMWWLLTTTLCVLTCGLCCGARKSSPNTKPKLVKKTASVNQSSNSLNDHVAKMTSKTTPTFQKRSKKGKN
ncbi:uncharacterized protein PHALS_03154 [Plasmopara halstedii]|uniref:Uncharacterized protein n=1 Tax=Plasmopara halstedii TaxID=4781 RepID=A0A0P1A7I3_PLAHL|nr:uncharacterized protein PHALS_03154 [Plasmopara halstedii]CEG36609.1 hypothetical protein PHALS_03154 [Plasmopara halstedii]|eukprot:XP_024572978.1 hypothetical protein PHALS_03154 [Plasmopara halstedii]